MSYSSSGSTPWLPDVVYIKIDGGSLFGYMPMCDEHFKSIADDEDRKRTGFGIKFDEALVRGRDY